VGKKVITIITIINTITIGLHHQRGQSPFLASETPAASHTTVSLLRVLDRCIA
jgi:hypothetical protein